MSETTKTAETAKKATEQTSRSSQAAIDPRGVDPKGIDAAGKSAKEATSETNQVAQDVADRAREGGQTMTETAAETVHTAASLTSKAAERSREVMLMGVRTAAGVGSQVADISFGRGQHMLSSAVQAMDIYREATERSAERVQALVSSYMIFGRGLQHMQHAWIEMLDHSMGNGSHKPQDVLRCHNIVELAEVQRDLYLDAINHAFASTTRLLDLAGRAAQEAVRPLQPHAH
jgi:hypothetical protein